MAADRRNSELSRRDVGPAVTKDRLPFSERSTAVPAGIQQESERRPARPSGSGRPLAGNERPPGRIPSPCPSSKSRLGPPSLTFLSVLVETTQRDGDLMQAACQGPSKQPGGLSKECQPSNRRNGGTWTAPEDRMWAKQGSQCRRYGPMRFGSSCVPCPPMNRCCPSRLKGIKR